VNVVHLRNQETHHTCRKTTLTATQTETFYSCLPA